MDEIWCDVCGAEFRNSCTCGNDDLPLPDKEERWIGSDGHAYVGNKKRASLAYHDTDNCACPAGKNFDPDSWY